MTKLNNEHIDQLFTFVKSKYVRYYDVQLELVDHLASAIEEEMKQKPYLTFEQALKKVYGRFPITGFAKFIIDKEKGLKTFWRKRFWTYISDYFKLPKIVITFFLSTLFFLSSQVQFTFIGLSFNLLYLLLLAFGLKSLMEQNNPLGQAQHPTYGKQGLLTHQVFLEQIGFFLSVPGAMIYGLVQAPVAISKAMVDNAELGMGFSICMAFTVIVLHAKNTVFIQWIEAEIQEKYPEYLTQINTVKT